MDASYAKPPTLSTHNTHESQLFCNVFGLHELAVDMLSCVWQSDGVQMLTMGARVRHMRERQGWTLDELAEKSGVNRTTLHRIEKTGHARAATLRKVADAFGVALPDLLAGMTNLGLAPTDETAPPSRPQAYTGEGDDTARSHAERTVLGLVGQVYDKHGDAGMEAAVDMLYGLLKRGVPKAGRHSGGGVQRTS